MRNRLRDLPLRSKVGLTMVAGGFAVLALVAFLSFGYWHDQLVSTAREQALVSATTAQATIQSALSRGDHAAARQTLQQLAATQTVEFARLHSSDGLILLSSDETEEGGRAARGAWLPTAGELPAMGVARTTGRGDVVDVFMPIRIAQPAVMELRYSMAPLRAAVRRGMWMGVGLVLLGLLALGFVLVTMLEREVVGPLQRMGHLLSDESAGGNERRPARDELKEIEASMVRLISHRREVEAREAERDLAADEREGFAQVGELAAEMAHEFKRPLASIRSAMDLLEQEYVMDPGSRDVLDSMHQQLERLSDTMRDLFSLARPMPPERTAVPVREVIDDALLGLAGHPALRSVEIVRDYAADDSAIAAEPRRIQQAVQNVVLNAAEAMPEGGTITLTIRATGGRIAIAVRDTGLGMTEEAVQQALRPFHSTKPNGTGLGLPLVVRILAAHGGELAIDSQPGQGTTVWLTLPAAGSDRQADHRADPHAAPAEAGPARASHDTAPDAILTRSAEAHRRQPHEPARSHG
ncbi:MAG TPA: ATP-binding protein [Longimicrobiales bacterium]|nr:ATP-binding protein [Longimicrobiales bacterium]